MQAIRKWQIILVIALLLSAINIHAQENNSDEAKRPRLVAEKVAEAHERLEIKFANPPLLEVELTKYLSSDLKKRRIIELTGILIEPLKTDKGLTFLPAQTRLRLKAGLRPGSYFGHPGEAVLWLDPFLIGQGIEGFSCDATPAALALHPALCQKTWRVSFDHDLDYVQTPENGTPLILTRKKKHEGITGTRNTRPQAMYYDPSGGNLDSRTSSLANRLPVTGALYELTTATAGLVRLVFSRRNLFLPSGTRVVFQLEDTLRLVAATDSTTRILKFEEESPKPKKKEKKADKKLEMGNVQ